MGSKTVNSSPYHPQSNGSCERKNGIIKRKLMYHVKCRGGEWADYLDLVLTNINHTKSESTGMTPHEGLTGSFSSAHFGSSRFIEDGIAAAYLVRKQIVEKQTKQRKKMQERHMKKQNIHLYSENEVVLLDPVPKQKKGELYRKIVK
jgi:hypothetical protein